MSESNLLKADEILTQTQKYPNNSRRPLVTQISGEPYYQIYKNFDYWLKFNNQNSLEERNVKLLLCLPLVPIKYHRQIRI